MEFKVGMEADFYGVDNNNFKLGDSVFEAVEDPEDGYRSMLAEVKTITDPAGLIFFQTPIARVRVKQAPESHSKHGYSESFEGYQLVDVADGHVWLLLGKDNADDYYPVFTFDYTPKLAAGVN